MEKIQLLFIKFVKKRIAAILAILQQKYGFKNNIASTIRLPYKFKFNINVCQLPCSILTDCLQSVTLQGISSNAWPLGLEK